MLHLARQPQGWFCLVEETAAAENLPKDFLAKVFQRLSHAGLLLSKRGPGGGYALSRPAENISIEEIVQGTDSGTHQEDRCFLENRACDAAHPCAIHDSVAQATELLRTALQRMTLADLRRDTDPQDASKPKRRVA
jgi:Rrf2 family protein